MTAKEINHVNANIKNLADALFRVCLHTNKDMMMYKKKLELFLFTSTGSDVCINDSSFNFFSFLYVDLGGTVYTSVPP